MDGFDAALSVGPNRRCNRLPVTPRQRRPCGPTIAPPYHARVAQLDRILPAEGRDFVKARIDNDKLVISDLRMGQEPVYVFSHIVAARRNPHWQEIPAELLPMSFSDRAIAQTWDRIWRDDERG